MSLRAESDIVPGVPMVVAVNGLLVASIEVCHDAPVRCIIDAVLEHAPDGAVAWHNGWELDIPARGPARARRICK